MPKEKKKFASKRKEVQKPNTVKQYFQTASITFEFANLEGRLAVSGQDVAEVERLLRLAVAIPSVAIFMEIDKPKKKSQERIKGLS